MSRLTHLRLASAAVTVAKDDSGTFTDIAKAISYAQKNEIPTVTVLAGTYPAVIVSATPSVVVVGESESNNDYTQNKVTIEADEAALNQSARHHR